MQCTRLQQARKCTGSCKRARWGRWLGGREAATHTHGDAAATHCYAEGPPPLLPPSLADRYGYRTTMDTYSAAAALFGVKDNLSSNEGHASGLSSARYNVCPAGCVDNLSASFRNSAALSFVFASTSSTGNANGALCACACACAYV